MNTSLLRPNPHEKVSVSTRSSCRLCGSAELELVLPLGPTPLADAYVAQQHLSIEQKLYPLDLHLCLDCGLAQLLEVVHADAVYVDYIYETTSSLGLIDHFDRYAEEVIARLGLSGNELVLDIGSNDGTLLSSFKQRGMQVQGVDPARQIAENATNAGIPTRAAFFTADVAKEIVAERGNASLVTANNIFANVDELDSMVEAIKHMLRPDGVFVFESFYLPDLIEHMVFDFIYHEHLSAFSVVPLKRFFERLGMNLFDAQRVPTKGGSLRYYVQNGTSRPSTDSLLALVELEQKAGIQKVDTFAKFFDRIQHAKSECSALIHQILSRGESIAGYGASATTTTLLYHFGLTDSLTFIADDYRVKHNLFSPRAHIPVLPSDALYTRNPNYVLILAWRYYEPILRRHPQFLEQGGKFIVPLPELKVIEQS